MKNEDRIIELLSDRLRKQDQLNELAARQLSIQEKMLDVILEIGDKFGKMAGRLGESGTGKAI